jgi:EthD domain
MPMEDQRAMALLVARPGQGGALRRRGVDLVAAWSDAVPHGGRARCLVRVDGGLLAGTHFEELCADLAPWDVALDVWAPDTDHLPVGGFRGLAKQLGDVVDPDRSSVLAGPQWRARQEPAPLGLTFCITRRPDLDHDGFVSYWRNEHAMLPFPRLETFCQFYVDADRSAALADLAEMPPGTYDGISEPTYRDESHFRTITLDDRVRVGARADELNFIDHSRSAATVFRTVETSSGKGTG